MSLWEDIGHRNRWRKREHTSRRSGRSRRASLRNWSCGCIYLTYRAIAADGGDCCSTKEVKPYRVKDEIYEGLGDRTTTSGRSVINDSMEHLRLMRYIRMKKDDKGEWMIYLNRPLDFLLPGEHEKYLEKYGITGEVRFLEQEE